MPRERSREKLTLVFSKSQFRHTVWVLDRYMSGRTGRLLAGSQELLDEMERQQPEYFRSLRDRPRS